MASKKQSSGVKNTAISRITGEETGMEVYEDHHLVIINADQNGTAVAEYYEETPSVQQGKTKWIWSPLDKAPGSFTLKDADSGKIGKGVLYKVSRKLSGGALLWLESFIYQPKNSLPTGWYVAGKCDPKIISATWHKYQEDNKGPEIKTAQLNEVVQLHVETEGLNGHGLVVEILTDDLRFKAPVKKQEQVKHGVLIINVRLKPSWSTELNALGLWKDSSETALFELSENEKVKEVSLCIRIKDTNNRNKYVGEEHACYLKLLNTEIKFPIPDGGIKPVTVGKIPVNAVRYTPCKYTAIIIRHPIKREGEGTRECIIFEEGITTKNISPFELVAGGDDYCDREVTINLNEYVTANQVWCNHPDEHGKKEADFEVNGIPQQPLKINNGAVKLKVKSSLSKLHPYPLNYIWPLRDALKTTYELRLLTCRYQKNVKIHVVPDIEWDLKVRFYNSDLPMERRHTNMPTDPYIEIGAAKADSGIFKKHQKKALEANQNTSRIKKFGKGETSFGLELTAKWNNGNHEMEFAAKYADYINTFLKVFIKIKEKMDEISHKKTVSSKTVLQKLMKKAGKLPVTMQIDYPGLFVGGTWKPINGKDEKVEIEGSVKVGFSPLIKGSGAIDLIACASYIPVVGQVIKVLDIAAAVSGLDTTFELRAIGEVNGEVEYTFGEKIKLELNGKLGLRLELSAKASGKINALIFEADYSVEAGGIAESYLEPKMSLGKSKEGAYVEGKVDFSGLIITVFIKAEADTGKRKFSNDPIGRKFSIVDRVEDIIKGEYYFIKSETNTDKAISENKSKETT